METIRRITSRGFVVIGGISTVIWAVTLATSKHHNPIWELLSVGLACFLVVALVELYNAKKQARQIECNERLLAAISAVARRGRDLLSQESITQQDNEGWVAEGQRELALHDENYAESFAKPVFPRMGDLAAPRTFVQMRLEHLETLRSKALDKK